MSATIRPYELLEYTQALPDDVGYIDPAIISVIVDSNIWTRPKQMSLEELLVVKFTPNSDIIEGLAKEGQSTITLSQPIHTAALISINGIVNDSSNYTITDNVLTFNTPLKFGDYYLIVDYKAGFDVSKDEFLATNGQSVFTLTDSINSYVVLAVNGIIYDSSQFTFVGNQITLNNSLFDGDVVVVFNYLYGYKSVLSEFTATAGQTQFVTTSLIDTNLLAIVNGTIISNDSYIISSNSITFLHALSLGDSVILINYNKK